MSLGVVSVVPGELATGGAAVGERGEGWGNGGGGPLVGGGVEMDQGASLQAGSGDLGCTSGRALGTAGTIQLLQICKSWLEGASGSKAATRACQGA